MNDKSDYRPSPESFAAMVDGAEDAFVIVDADQRICFVNSHGEDMFGYVHGELVGQLLSTLLPERSRLNHVGLFRGFRNGEERARRMSARGDIWGLRSDGTEFPLRASIVKVDEGDRHLLVAIVRDASDEYEILTKLENQARRDPLTNLYNRRAFLEMAETEAQRFERFGGTFCIAMVDIDHFKQINDVHGHPMGDYVIRTVGQICQARLRTIDVVARFGGEEYALLLVATDEAGGRIVCERMRSAIAAETFDFDKEPRSVTASFGIAEAKAGMSVEDILARADAVLYRAKGSGRNRVAIASAEPPDD